MFFVKDTLKDRQNQIRSFLPEEPMIAVLLAAADFEWTVRRAILALGKCPTKDIRECLLSNASGLRAYSYAWNREVKPRLRVSLEKVIPNWNFFANGAYPLRHRLIHGEQGAVGEDFARDRTEAFLGASRALTDFAANQDEPIYSRRIVRRKAR